MVYNDRFGGLIRPKPSHYTTKRLKSTLPPCVRQPSTYLVQSLP